MGDTTVENEETFTVSLSAVSGATVATASAIGTILNDDQSDASPLDVDGNTRIEGLDVLLVINELLLHGSYTIDHSTMGTSRDKFDRAETGLFLQSMR